MKIITLIPLVTMMALAGCQSGGTQTVYHSIDSEGGRAITSMGSAQALYQKRVEVYQEAMVTYEEERTGEKKNIFYSSLLGPKETISPTAGIYKLQGAYKVGDYVDYKVLITFEDESRTIVKSIEIIEKLNENQTG
jgi:hypothetical protein